MVHLEIPPACHLNLVLSVKRKLFPSRSAAAHLVEHEQVSLGRSETEMHLAVLAHRKGEPLARRWIIKPGVLAGGHGFREYYVRLTGFAHMGVHKEEHIASVIGDILILKQEPVRIADRQSVRKIVLLHHAGVPFKIFPVSRLLKQDEIVLIFLQTCYSLGDLLVTSLEILESQRLLWIFSDAEHPSATFHELLQLGEGLRCCAGHLYDEQGAIFLRPVADLAIADCCIPEDDLADIVRAAAVLVDGLPDQRRVRNIQGHRERLGLHAHRAPHVVVGRQDGDVGEHVGVLELAGEPGAVVVQLVHVRPPGVPLVVEGPVLNPARELGLKRGVVETMPNRMGYAGDRAHVGADLQELKTGREHLVGVGHLLGADKTLAGKVGRRRDIFVNHRVGASAAVVLVAHLLTDPVLEPVGRPGLPFRNVLAKGRLLDEEAVAIGLGAGFHTFLPAPGEERVHVPLVEQLGLREFEVETHTVHLVLELIAFL